MRGNLGRSCGDQVDQNNYPEMLGKTAIINGGAVIGFVFPLVRPFLDKRTQNKIEVCTPNTTHICAAGSGSTRCA